MAIKQKLWITTFEFGPEKFGGLGEVPTNQVKHLGNDIDITVLMPAHGCIHGASGKKVKSKKLDYDLDFVQQFKGIIDDPANKVLEGYPAEARVKVSLYELILAGMNAKILAFSGGDELTRRILDDPVIYSTTGLKAKIAIFSRAIKEYALREAKVGNIPHVVHVHDYHAVPGVIGIRQVFLDRGFDTATILTIHLLTGPKVTGDFLACCGVADTALPFLVNGTRVMQRASEILPTCKNKLEYLAAQFADLVTSVSNTYLIENVIPNCGGERLTGKTDFIHNGCDWEHDQIEAAAIETCRPELETFLGKKVMKHANRHDLRRFLSTCKLGQLPPGEPVIDDPDLLQIIKQFDGMPPFIQNGRVASFPVDGKLCMITGRASKQKGMDIMLDAIPLVLAEYPAINFLVFSLPTQGERGLITTYTARAMEPVMRDHVRYAWGKASSLFTLAHLAADLYLAPSRWEPFGIMVLEANALGLPVIGASVGGIKETIIDARENDAGGTGLLIEKENPSALASAIIDMAMAIDACEAKDPSIAVHITDIRLKRAVIKNPGLYDLMRSNARKHVEKSFRWAMVARKELDLIAKAIANKHQRQQ